MKITRVLYFIGLMMLIASCNRAETASEVLQKTINSIDTIESIYYKQDMSRTDPRDTNDTIFRYREMYFERLISDSIVGVKGHWYMFTNDKINPVFEDIFDGKRLIRKSNRDSVARLYDLVKYPDFKKNHFWSHNTLYGMQYEFKHVLDNPDSYTLEKLNDTIIGDTECYQILISLENMTTMPGFATQLEPNEGLVLRTTYYIDKQTYYTIGMYGVNYSTDSPEQQMFIDQKYSDIKFNIKIKDSQFDTSQESISGYKIQEMKPD